MEFRNSGIVHGLIEPIPYSSVERRVRFRSEEHTSELQSQSNLVCRLLLEKKKYFDQLWSGEQVPQRPQEADVDAYSLDAGWSRAVDQCAFFLSCHYHDAYPHAALGRHAAS